MLYSESISKLYLCFDYTQKGTIQISSAASPRKAISLSLSLFFFFKSVRLANAAFTTKNNAGRVT